MFFHTTLTVPVLTSELAPVSARMAVSPGIVEEVLIGFPPGCKGLVHLSLWDKNWQVWPWTPRTSFAWDGYIFTIRDRYVLSHSPYELVLKAWSEDDTYEHTVFAAVRILEGIQHEPAMDLQIMLGELNAL